MAELKRDESDAGGKRGANGTCQTLTQKGPDLAMIVFDLRDGI
jgi:hypothetical protein